VRAYAHQEKALREAVANLQRHGFHAFFMEVGTGKSKTLLDTGNELHRLHALDAIIICGPKSLAGTWKEQVATHCAIPNYGFVSYDSTKARTQKWQEAFSLVNDDVTVFPIYFINTEAFQTMPVPLVKALSAIMALHHKVLLVIDESSDIKGPKAQRSLNLSKFGASCAYRVIMTGTEITNSILDLYMQFEFLKKGFWGFKSFFFFKNYYAILEERYLSGGRTFKEIVGFRKLDEIQSKIAPYASRARKADCLDLPEKIYANLPVQLEGECARVYADMKANLFSMLKSGELVTVANKVALFTKFRQITGGTLAGSGIIDENPGKIQALVDELADHNEQAIIWSCFTEEIDLLVRKLGKLWTVARFDGKTGESDRVKAIDDFRSGAARLFIANPAAASQGLNLQCAHIQYWYSLPTQAKHFEQGEGRTHRSGQTHACLYKKIIAEGTVDERVARLMAEKTDLMAHFRDGTVADMIELV